jgi:hypothetical protein
MLRKALLQVFSYSIADKLLTGLTGFLIIRVMTPEQYSEYTYLLAILSALSSIIIDAYNRIYIIGKAQINLLYKNAGSFFLSQIILLIFISIIAYPFFNNVPILFFSRIYISNLIMC